MSQPRAKIISRTAVAAVLCAVYLTAAAGAVSARKSAGGRLNVLTIEQLMEIDVVSVSKRAEKLSTAPAAIFVITAEDIRRSGATSIPEALRMAPGLQVARIDSNKWVVSARGFAEQFANKLLVMIDGRTVYTPLFSGVFWDVQDVMLEDIDRIEVIRGPGATLWGANAVNGVINIMTRKAGETQGLLASGGYGNEEKGFGALRFGTKLGDDFDLRTYVRYFNRDRSRDLAGNRAGDEWDMLRTGFRMDGSPGDGDDVTLQGDFYDGKVGSRTATITSIFPAITRVFDVDEHVRGGNLLMRWSRRFSEDSNATLQAYYDRTERELIQFIETRDTVDLDFQHSLMPFDWNRFTWGAGYRWTRDHTEDTVTVEFDEKNRTGHLGTAFLQNEVTLFDDLLRIIIGSKFEYNSYTGFEVQPSGRLVVVPNQHHTLWGSVSRAVRTPSRADDDVGINLSATPSTLTLPTAQPPFFVNIPYTLVTRIEGDRSFKSEEVTAFELGYRFLPNPRFSIDVAVFYNQYENVRSTEIGPLPTDAEAVAIILGGGPLVVPLIQFGNGIHGHTYGVEISASWQVVERWRLIANYSYLHIDLHTKNNSNDTSTVLGIEGSSPTHQASLRSQLNLPWNLEFDVTVNYAENLPSIGSTLVPDSIPSRLGVDLRLGAGGRQTSSSSASLHTTFRSRDTDNSATDSCRNRHR